jgi:copper transport protein
LFRRSLLAALLCALCLPAAAWSHANLLRTEPRDGAVVAKAPTVVRVFFDDDVRPASGIRAIRNGGGSVLGGKARVTGGRTLVVPLKSGLSDGDYTVLWKVISDDGHKLAGVMTFGVGVGRPPPVAALTVSNDPTIQDVIARWLFFAGLLTAGGAALFRLFVGPVPSRLMLCAFLLVFIGVSSAVHDVSISTRFGSVMAFAAIVAGCGALLSAIAPLYPRLELVPVVAGLILLPVPSLAGHALDAGRGRFQVIFDIVHVGAASLWLGGLLALGLALRRRDDRPETVRRFSKLAVWAVLAIAVTGVLRAISELDAVSQLWTTGYGRVLIVKSVLLATLVGIGWMNRYRLIPRHAVQKLRRNVAVELALFAVLIAAVALLTDLRPGRDRAAAAAAVPSLLGPPPLPAGRAIVQAQQDGTLGVALAYRPPGAEVTVLGQDGTGVSGLDVRIAGRPARPCGPGCYGAFIRPAKRMTVSVSGRTLVFTLPPSRRPASALVSRATKTFRGLRSVDYVERLASSPRDRVVADFTLESPNRLQYRIRGGASGIIIGAKRWDKQATGPWQPSPQQPTSQPEPIWAGGFTNAYLLKTTPTTYVVSFMKPIGPAWFTLTLNRKTMRPTRLHMTAAAHFMTHAYTGFNRPLSIRPPR